MANVRLHQTTQAVPVERLAEEQLQPHGNRLNYDTALYSSRRVARDCSVAYEGNRYSVPWRLVGRDVVAPDWRTCPSTRPWRTLTSAPSPTSMNGKSGTWPRYGSWRTEPMPCSWGPPGVGKTHLAVSLAVEAVPQGVGTYFIAAHDLVSDLRKAHAENRLERRLRVYTSPRLLIIDEMGYIPFGNMEATVFFQLVSKRYEKNASIILTSNKSFGDWGSILGDQVIATAILRTVGTHDLNAVQLQP